MDQVAPGQCPEARLGALPGALGPGVQQPGGRRSVDVGFLQVPGLDACHGVGVGDHFDLGEGVDDLGR